MKNRLKIGGIILTICLVAFRPFTDKKVVVIDAGHGGTDIGVYIGAAYEKQIVEDIAKRIKALNKKDDIEIILIRNTDVLTSLDERVQKINQIRPDLVISLHINQSDDKAANGLAAAVSEQNPHYKASLAHAENLIQATADKNLSKGTVKKVNQFLLKEANSPAVTLELGFLSNEKDKSYLMSEKGQTTIAKGILKYLYNK